MSKVKKDTDLENKESGSSENKVFTSTDGECDRRILDLRQRAQELSGGGLIFEALEKLPPEVEEQLLQQIITFETADQVDLFDLLIQNGVSLPAPVLVSESQIQDKLWETIYSLSSVGCYLENTDHLSDRELYTVLWEQLLHEPAILFPDDPSYAYHIDTIGSGSLEDQQTYLRYYASEEDRRHWQNVCPDILLPSSASRPYDRDRHLPRPFASGQRATPLM